MQDYVHLFLSHPLYLHIVRKWVFVTIVLRDLVNAKIRKREN